MRKITEKRPWIITTLSQASVITAVAIVINASRPTPAEAIEPVVTINILVANYAKVPPRDLSTAERLTGSIFHDARIDMTWLDLPLGGMHTGLEYTRSGDFFLRIMGETAPAPSLFRHKELAFALPCGEPKIGCGAYISYPSVEALAGARVANSDILGVAMAHEIGHLLLGGDHSSTGIMKRRWSEQDLRGAAWHQLIFTPDQAKHLHAAAVLLRSAIDSAEGKRE